MVALTGTGVSTMSYAVDLTWNPPASSSDPVVGYHIYRVNGHGFQFSAAEHERECADDVYRCERSKVGKRTFTPLPVWMLPGWKVRIQTCSL